jgi:outer membrane protein assembly factor BamD (BamD/ComL family)
MTSAGTLVLRLIPLFIALVFLAWGLWEWFKRSDEPGVLVVRWIITVVTMGGLLVVAARAQDGFAKIGAVLLGAVVGLVMVFVWGGRFTGFVGDWFASLYTGGNQEIEPTPFYAIAEAKRKRGDYAQAIIEIEKQLERFPTDFQGWMLIAEIQAENLKDFATARQTVETILSQPDHAPKNIAYALNRQADWHLKFDQDREAARAALERIVDLLPDTEQAQVALQRIARLTPDEGLVKKQEPERVSLPRGEENLGLRQGTAELRPSEESQEAAAGRLVKQLEEHPYDNESREKLALIYGRHYRRLELATDQLEQLIGYPNQPAKQVVHWLNLLADLQIELAADLVLARQTLQRIIDLYPKTAAADNASNRLAYLKLELRPQKRTEAIKLGSYEQNIGLKRSDAAE